MENPRTFKIAESIDRLQKDLINLLRMPTNVFIDVGAVDELLKM